MELCGRSLLDVLAGDGDELRCEVDLRRLVVEMLLGVAHVHSVHVVHRDIKPENFLLGGDGGRRVKLCDFGLAAELPPGGLLSGVFGTSPYMSPEMAAGRGHGLATDLWSYGVCVHLTPRWPLTVGCHDLALAGADKDMGLSDTGSTATPPGSL